MMLKENIIAFLGSFAKGTQPHVLLAFCWQVYFCFSSLLPVSVEPEPLEGREILIFQLCRVAHQHRANNTEAGPKSRFRWQGSQET